MAFGVYTKVLKDDFNRANEAPATGWTDDGGAGLRVLNNALTMDVGGGVGYWAADAALTDFEAYFLIAAVPNGSDYLSWRSDGTNDYTLYFGNGDVVRNPGGNFLFSTTVGQPSIGQELCLQMIGTHIELFVNGVSKGSGSDAVLASGRISLPIWGTLAVDSFSLGVPSATLDNCLPDADVTTTGWTTTPLFSKVNDASDATVIQSTAV